MFPRSSPAPCARSPEAERFDPPLVRRDWIVPVDQPFERFVEEAGDAWPLGPRLFAGLLAHGALHLDGRPVDPSHPPARVGAGTRATAWGFEREPAAVTVDRSRVLLDGDGIVAVDKPPWITTQGSRASQRHSLERRLADLLGEPGLAAVHRLDRQTSGVVLFARTPAAAAWMERELRAFRVRRLYLAWVAPPPDSERLRVSGWIRRVPHPARFAFGLSPRRVPDGRFSETTFRVRLRCERRALLEARPSTGRTHQIRVHLAARGHAVVGDDLYGPPWAPGPPSSAGRTLLHARRIEFRPPGAVESLVVEAPLPADFPAEGSGRSQEPEPRLRLGPLS